ncbi:response regulator [Pedobacter metabolipauper]|uniref:LuxR family two component transcriptional regulator n=1 Tax=Pedobacter metabolipauper TaxID=425513 RepID=A0A4R6SPE9_9SPHI|nr:response regulator transcription factor [Pedobacter metabolipauper]TDQ06403.1 LuxR family two component transcriptional regulator [Pedobacter metabolipauper]
MYTPLHVSVVIIEDDETVRNGYAYLINRTAAFTVVNTYPSFDASRNHIVNDNPDVVIIDIQLPGTSGIEALPVLKKMLPFTHFIVLTIYETEKLIIEALSNGASGYLTKNMASSRIINAIKEVMLGGGSMSPNVAKTLIRSLQKNQNSPLTKRETQILELISIGKNRSQVARELFIEIDTVKTHVKNIYLKLHVNSKADAIKVAKLNRLI